MQLRKPFIFKTTFAVYVAKEIIGEGGSGRILRAFDEADNPWAIKLLNPQRLSKEGVKRFKNELTFCLNNKHPNVVSVVDHGIFVDDKKAGISCPFYIMHFYACSLRKLIYDGIPKNKVLPYFSNVLDGIEAAHLQRITHRDLKPENILFDEVKDTLLIADFGIAQFEVEELYTAVETKDSERLANFQYAAPEQRARGQRVDHRADIYALGLILNEMFTRQVPYGTGYKMIATVAPDFGYLDDLVSALLRQSPDERISSVEAIKEQLIARGNEFINQQKISESKKTVILDTEIDDPLILDPPRLINFDWDRGNLSLILSQPVNAKWIWALQNMGNYTSLWGKTPERLKFSQNVATIHAREDQVQEIINFFKSWLPRANQVYEQRIRRDMEEEKTRKRQELQRQIEEQEARQRVLKKVKI